jgi:hypothetical protein
LSGWTANFNASALSAGSHTLYLQANNSFAPSNAAYTVTTTTYSFTVLPAAPVITSSLTTSGTINTALSPTYTITATNTPTSYNATGLPAGLSVNTSTGVISGTPTASGITNVNISATNAYGTGTATLQITINGPPVINSSLTKSGTVGVPLAPVYIITASNAPTSYNATGLPAGLSVNTSTGVITGTPTASGVTSVTISATNSYGTGSATLVLTVNPAASDTANSLLLQIHVPTP